MVATNTPIARGKVRYIQLRNVENDITFVVPKNYGILAIFYQEKNAAAVTGGIKIGTTDGGTDVVSAQAVGASDIGKIADSALAKSFFSRSANTTLYLQDVSSWNSAKIDVDIMLAKLGNQA